MHGELGEDDHAAGRQREADQGHDANAEAGDELARDDGARCDSCRQRKERGAGAQGAIPEDLLQIKRDEEERREHGG